MACHSGALRTLTVFSNVEQATTDYLPVSSRVLVESVELSGKDENAAQRIFVQLFMARVDPLHFRLQVKVMLQGELLKPIDGRHQL